MDRKWNGVKIAAGLTLLAGQAVAGTPTGLRVYAELWNPSKLEGESLLTLENQPSAVSDALNQSWAALAAWYSHNVPGLLFGQDRLHALDSSIPAGISLYSRTGALNQPPEVTLPAQPTLSLSSLGTNAFAVDLRVAGSTLSLCATTPSASAGGIHIGVGKYADPCATFNVDLDLTMNIAISDVPGQFLKITNPRLTPSNFRITNGNWTVQIAEVVNSINTFFGGTDYPQLLANVIDQSQDLSARLQGPIDALNAHINALQQSALARINQQLAPVASLGSLAHIALWEQNSAQGQMLTLLFAPPSAGVSLGGALQNGQVSGSIRFDATSASLPSSCAPYNNSPQFAGRVQTGPRAITAIRAGNPVYGAAPFQSISVQFNGGGMQGNQCTYTLNHLAMGMPNFIDLNAGDHRASQLLHVLQLQPDHWANPVIVGPGGTVLATGTDQNRLDMTNVAAQSLKPDHAASAFKNLTEKGPQRALNLIGSVSSPSLVKSGTPQSPFATAKPTWNQLGTSPTSGQPGLGQAPQNLSQGAAQQNRWKVP